MSTNRIKILEELQSKRTEAEAEAQEAFHAMLDILHGKDGPGAAGKAVVAYGFAMRAAGEANGEITRFLAEHSCPSCSINWE